MYTYENLLKSIKENEIYFDRGAKSKFIIIHFSSDLNLKENRFCFLLGLLKLKVCVPSDVTIKIVCDYCLDDDLKDLLVWLFNELKFCNQIEMFDAEELLDSCSLEEVFAQLNKVPLFYKSNDCSFWEKAQRSIYELEKKHLHGNHVYFWGPNKAYNDDDYCLSYNKFEVCCHKELSDILLSGEALYGFIMSINDEQTANIYSMLLSYKMDSFIINDILVNPFEMKKNLAEFLVGVCWNDSVGKKAREHFEARISKHNYSDKDFIVVTIDLQTDLFTALYSTGKFKSKSELIRLFKQAAVKNLSGELLGSNVKAYTCDKIKVGKHLLFKLVTNND